MGGRSVPAAFPEEWQVLFLLELIPPTAEDGCVASAFHRAVSFSLRGVGSNQSSGITEKEKALKEMSDTTGCACWMVAE